MFLIPCMCSLCPLYLTLIFTKPKKGSWPHHRFQEYKCRCFRVGMSERSERIFFGLNPVVPIFLVPIFVNTHFSKVGTNENEIPPLLYLFVVCCLLIASILVRTSGKAHSTFGGIEMPCETVRTFFFFFFFSKKKERVHVLTLSHTFNSVN